MLIHYNVEVHYSIRLLCSWTHDSRKGSWWETLITKGYISVTHTHKSNEHVWLTVQDILLWPHPFHETDYNTWEYKTPLCVYGQLIQLNLLTVNIMLQLVSAIQNTESKP